MSLAMYSPKPFRMTEPADQHAAISTIGLASLVVHGAEGLEAVPVPLVLDPARGETGMLRGHVARANPIWRRLEGAQVLLIFQGPQGYVSPDWYETPLQVPTWNYLVLHVHGTARLLDDTGTRRMLADLSAVYEERLRPKAPWTLDKLPAGTLDGLQRAIVGFEVAIARIEGKAKLSQNKQSDDIRGVIAGLRQRDDGTAHDLASLMERQG